MTNKVTVPRALGIKCPYTGDTIDVYLSVSNGCILYSCPHAFSLAEPVGSLEELQDRASMRNGVHGAADGAKRPVCAYTGEDLRLRALPDGRFAYAGGFNPRRAFTDLDMLLYYLTMRDGEATRQKPGAKPPVAPAAPKAGERADMRVQPGDATLEAMEKLASEHMQRGTTVSMAGGKGGKGGKGGSSSGKGK